MFICVSRSEDLCYQWFKSPEEIDHGIHRTRRKVGPRLSVIFQVSPEVCSTIEAVGPLFIKSGPTGVIGDGVAV